MSSFGPLVRPASQVVGLLVVGGCEDVRPHLDRDGAAQLDPRVSDVELYGE